MRNEQDPNPKLQSNRNMLVPGEYSDFSQRNTTENFISPRYQERERVPYDDTYEYQGQIPDQKLAPRMPRNQVRRQTTNFAVDQFEPHNLKQGNPDFNNRNQEGEKDHMQELLMRNSSPGGNPLLRDHGADLPGSAKVGNFIPKRGQIKEASMHKNDAEMTYSEKEAKRLEDHLFKTQMERDEVKAKLDKLQASKRTGNTIREIRDLEADFKEKDKFVAILKKNLREIKHSN